MSLLIWLPLISDLHNRGLSDSTITNNGATLNANGKLGGCYSFNGSSSYLLGTHNVITNNTDDWSFSCWMKLNATTQGQCLFSCRNGASSTGITVFYYGSQWLVDDGVRWQFTPTVTIAKATWYHICVVRKKGIGKYLYVNGALDSSTTTVGTQSTVNTSYYAIGSSQNSTSTVSGNPVNGYLSDARFYDEALSQKQIKLLSQGLVAHYTLGDRYLEGTTNLVTSYTAGGRTTLIEGGKAVQTTGENSDTYFRINLSSSLVSGTTYTLSMYARGISSDSYWGFRFNNNASFPFYVYSGYNTYTFTATSELVGVLNPLIDDVNRPDWANKATFYNIQLEAKDHSTGYAGMGGTRDETTVYDSSGYNYHGTASGTLTVSSDAPRYSVSTQFSSGSHIDTALVTGGFANTYTFAWWGYIVNYTSHMMWGFSDGNRLNLYMSNNGNNFYWNTGDGSANPFGSIKPSDYKYAWHYFTITGDGTTSKLYIDGEFKANATAYRRITGSTIYMNGWNSGTMYNCNGKLSDFRLYSTCLSADDIRELYQVGASIDRSGNMYAYEFNEV